jgi:hypothetical protein
MSLAQRSFLLYLLNCCLSSRCPHSDNHLSIIDQIEVRMDKVVYVAEISFNVGEINWQAIQFPSVRIVD